VSRIRFVCIDDHPVISDAIGRAAADCDDLELLGAFTSIESVPKPLRSPDTFDVALLDLSLPGLAGIDGVRAVVGWGVRVLVYTATAGSRHAETVLAAGGAGFVAKSATTSQVLDSIRAVARGERVTVGLEAPDAPFSRLTDADRRLLDALTEQTRSKDLARELFLSPGTVDNLIAQLYWKLGLEESQRTRASLRDWARRNGYGSSLEP
jgi:two-component system response regulator DesR